jgi:hypothetical protein
MFHKEDAGAQNLSDANQKFPKVANFLIVSPGRRFVEKQEARLKGHGPGQFDKLLLSER